MKKLLVIVFIVLIGFLGINFGRNAAESLKGNKEVLPAVLSNDTSSGEDARVVEIGTPQTLSIPKINVNATVESVAQDNKGAMDIPKNSKNVAWYNLGPKPGASGSSVMAGHKDERDGSPSVFWDLKKLEKGDKIIVTDENGEEHTYSVTDKAEYPDANFPLQKVFNTPDKKMLNLITCEGTWNSATRNYSHRTVVYSELDE